MSRDDACVPAGVVDDPEVSCYDCPTGMASMTDCPLSLKDFEAEQGCHDNNDDAQVMNPPLGYTFQCPFGTIPYETVCLKIWTTAIVILRTRLHAELDQSHPLLNVLPRSKNVCRLLFMPGKL